MKLNTKQTEESAINILKARLARLHVDTGFNVNDKTPISDGFIALYTSSMGKEFKKSDFFGKIEVQIKGTRNQKNKKSKKFPLTTVGLNSIKRNGGLLFFVVYLNDDGVTGDICFRELSPLLIDRYLKNMHGKQKKLFQFLPFPEDDNEANNLLLRSLTQISDQQPLVLWNKDENPKQMDSGSIGIKVFSNESLEETLRTTDVVLYKNVDNMHVPVGVVSPEKIEIFHSKKVSVQFPGQKQAIISKLEVYDDKLILRVGNSGCIKLIFIKDSNVVHLDLKDAPNLDEQLNNVIMVLKLLNSDSFLIDDKEVSFESNSKHSNNQFEARLKKIYQSLQTISGFEDSTHIPYYEIEHQGTEEEKSRLFNLFRGYLNGNEIQRAGLYKSQFFGKDYYIVVSPGNPKHRFVFQSLFQKSTAAFLNVEYKRKGSFFINPYTYADQNIPLVGDFNGQLIIDWYKTHGFHSKREVEFADSYCIKLIFAFDRTHRKTFLNTSISCYKLILQSKYSDSLVWLNYVQTLFRKNCKLPGDIQSKLFGLIGSKYSEEKFGAGVLLQYSNDDLLQLWNDIPSKEQQTLLSYPITNLLDPSLRKQL